MSRLSDRTRLRVAKDNVWSELGDEVVILDLSSSSYLGLEEVGSTVWGLLAEPRTVEELESRLEALYDVDPEELRRDLRPFLQELVDRGLVLADEDDTSPLP